MLASRLAPLVALLTGCAGPPSAAQPPGETVAPPVEIVITGANLSLFPTPGEPAVIRVRARKLIDEPGSLRCRVLIDNFKGAGSPGYAASPEVALTLDEPDKWYEARFDIAVVRADPLLMTTGKLLVRGSVGGQAVRREAPLRIGVGALAFLERRPVQFADGVREIDVACLENAHLRAEFVPVAGCLSGLMSHESGRDLLVSGEFPLGFLWSGATDWYHKSFSGPGATVWTEFTTRIGGRKVLMRASLGAADETLRIEIDTGELAVSPGPIYIMVTAGAEGEDLVRVATGVGPVEIAPGPTPRRLAAQAKNDSWIAFSSAELDETLRVDFRAPALVAVEIGAQAPWYDYVALHLGDGAPGAMEFVFSIRPKGR